MAGRKNTLQLLLLIAFSVLSFIYFLFAQQVVYRDIDNDNILEEAHDSDNDLSNGYENFFDPNSSSVLRFKVDGDGDNKPDFFISTNIYILEPNLYWDPDDNSTSTVKVVDVNDDGIDDAVFDSNFDGMYDKFFDGFDKKVYYLGKIKGKVTESLTSWPIPYARVIFYNYAGEIQYTTVTSSAGIYNVNCLVLYSRPYTVVVKADGYVPKKISQVMLKHNTTNYIDISLEKAYLPKTKNFLHIYPNPCKKGDNVNFVFAFDKDGEVTIYIYDLLGRRVATIFEKKKYKADTYSEPVYLHLDTGFYFAVLLINNEMIDVKKIVVLQ